MNISDIRELTDSEIRARIKEEAESLTKLRFNNSISEVENPARIRITRKTIARLKTVLRERELNNAQEG